MTGKQFERDFCELLRKKGYWALNIPKNETGAQPFDVIAIKGDNQELFIMAMDCKVCKADRFPLDRIEYNQWIALEDISKRGGYRVVSGLAILHDEEVYCISLIDLKGAVSCGMKSITFSGKKFNNIEDDMFHAIKVIDKSEIEAHLGRFLV